MIEAHQVGCSHTVTLTAISKRLEAHGHECAIAAPVEGLGKPAPYVHDERTNLMREVAARTNLANHDAAWTVKSYVLVADRAALHRSPALASRCTVPYRLRARRRPRAAFHGSRALASRFTVLYRVPQAWAQAERAVAGASGLAEPAHWVLDVGRGRRPKRVPVCARYSGSISRRRRHSHAVADQRGGGKSARSGHWDRDELTRCRGGNATGSGPTA
jgi:hypothetical protein